VSYAHRFGRAVAKYFGLAPQVHSIGLRPPRDAARWPDWISSGLTIDRLASVQRQADQGYLCDLMALEQEIAGRDPLISGLLSTRLSALSQRPVKCNPSKADRDPQRAQAVADFGQSILEGLRLARREGERTRTEKGLAGLVEGLAMASYYGAAVGWTHWGHRAGDPKPRPLAVEFFDERRLGFDVQTEAITLATQQSGFRGVPLSCFDPALVLEVRSTRISRRLSMAGAGRAILLPWWIRFGALKDLADYAATWVKPALVGKPSANAPGAYGEDAVTTFKQFLEDFVGDTRVLLPPGFEVDVLQAAPGGEAVFDALEKITERHLQFALVGQTGTASGEGGSLAKAEVNERVRDDLIAGDARMVAEALECLLSHAVAVEFGCGVPAPEVTFEAGESVEDQRARALVIQGATYPLVALLNRGVPVDVPEYCQQFGIPLREDGRPDPLYPSSLQQQLAVAKPASPSGSAGAVGEPPSDPAASAEAAGEGSFSLSAHERQLIADLRAAHGGKAPDA
jgi:hypothetical protein